MTREEKVTRHKYSFQQCIKIFFFLCLGRERKSLCSNVRCWVSCLLGLCANMLPKWLGRPRLAVLFGAALCCAEAVTLCAEMECLHWAYFSTLRGWTPRGPQWDAASAFVLLLPLSSSKSPSPSDFKITRVLNLGMVDNPGFSAALCSEQIESVGASHTLNWQTTEETTDEWCYIRPMH